MQSLRRAGIAHASATAIALAATLAACGDDDTAPTDAPPEPPAIRVEIVGHSDLLARGMNAALAVAGDTVYVGSRIDGLGRSHSGVLIVDVADPAAPTVVGEIGRPEEAVTGLSSRELRAIPDLDLLIVLNLICAEDLHGCGRDPQFGPLGVEELENLRFYDISDRRAPVLIGRYDFMPAALAPTSPHEMFLWRDPANPAHVVLHLSTPAYNPSYRALDISDPRAPVLLSTWDPIIDGPLPEPRSGDNLLHSVSVSDDGRTGYFSHLQGGLFLADLSAVTDGLPDAKPLLVTPPEARADWAPPEPAGPHSAVRVPGRDLLVATDEVYPQGWGAGCPWGWMRLVDIADPAAPRVLSEYKLPENDPSVCTAQGGPARVTFTAHNATATANLALVSWHAGGLQVVDISDPAAPAQLAELRPEPLAAVTTEDPALGGNPLAFWSYPVIANGLIYVVDIRNGLYILRYVGPHDEELAAQPFREGNSNLTGR